jgi:dimethylamine monooxygenase subunit A
MPILQRRLPFAPWTDPRRRRLPGIEPLEPADWLLIDDAFAAQMAERDRLIATAPEAVHALAPEAVPAARELLARVLAELARRPDYRCGEDAVIRPDGVRVPVAPQAPLLTLGRLVQEDFCILQVCGPEHVMTGAILCFPASWTLAEKFGRPLVAIHGPVAEYDAGLAARVQRLFDAIRPERPLWRANVLAYSDPTLHQPRSETAPRERAAASGAAYVRSERQCLLRLPESRSVIFSIHTCVVARDSLTADEAAALAAMEG